MRKFGKALIPVLAVVALLIIGNPSFLWATPSTVSGLKVPEIDPSSGLVPIAFLAGTIAVIRGWRT